MSVSPLSILVIRLGALGDLIFCMPAFQAIRRAHPDAKIGLLTRKPFADFARHMPWFDEILIDPAPSSRDFTGWRNLRDMVRDFAPQRVYDLQGKTRQSILYALLGGPWGPEWSGAAPFCKFPRIWPPRPEWHFMDFLAAQLRVVGVEDSGSLDLDWLDASVDFLNLPEKFVVLIPACSPGAEFKRWPAEYYAELARDLIGQGYTCLAVGTRADASIIDSIRALAQQVIDLSGRTDLFQLAAVLRRASFVIGNDTGPTHLAGVLGRPTLALFSGFGNPVWSHPPGPHVKWLQAPTLDRLSVADVVSQVRE